MSADAYALAEEVLRLARAAGLTIVTAESCTGGLAAAALTEVPGASDVVDRGFVTYSNAAKVALLGVPEATLEAYGAVSEPTARAMAEGALARAGAGLSVAITGVAGPGGGSDQKPVGLVHFAAARAGRATLHRERRFGDLGRAEVRRRATLEALDLLREAAGATAFV
ncbi:competence damage-inducible protein A [Methylopila jiangsuensis]|uniref:Competence damage-inducible protein A n=1 Tax=Methylopila jiangsuensis TaxID=586230 RepID=A0A9W6N2U3_9HYPH|nr:nicotinamide-nucleotide amidohydrolase family protein [Methylopila jiangsuensis]MDR6285808.1 nicotinamide-nucleotide amidase [Methylopila jiangsuensis]GLK75566.1 competence damage-inducible protein A [Methylopila jiangsuensis]